MPDARIAASPVERALKRARAVPRTLSRPPQMVERTRWVFWMLTMISLALAVPGTIAGGRGLGLLALAGIALLAGSLVVGYLTRRAHRGLDLLDAVALTAMACAASTPAAVFPLLFAMIWFRSLYGTTPAALLRVVLYGASMIGVLLLGSYLPGGVPDIEAPMVLSAIPTMFVTVVAARHLAGIMSDRQQAAQRDAIHAAAGSRLLGVTDPAAILGVARQTVVDICAVTPGLRCVVVSHEAAELRVSMTAGPFVAADRILTEGVRAALQQTGVPVLAGLPELNEAAGSACEWTALLLPGSEVDDYLVVGAPRLPSEVVDVLTSVTTLVAMAQRNSHAHHELTTLATMDSLTGLANRALFTTTLSRTLTHSAAPGTAVLFVDLDDFKDVNDTFGHSAGDELLRHVAARLTAATRTGDLCARLGGDEFAVLLPGTGVEDATDIAGRIVDAVGEPMELAEGPAQVGASIGLAVDGGDSTPEQLVQRADIAMYAAKAGGKGRVQLFSDGLLRDDAEQISFGLERQLQTTSGDGELAVL